MLPTQASAELIICPLSVDSIFFYARVLSVSLLEIDELLIFYNRFVCLDSTANFLEIFPSSECSHFVGSLKFNIRNKMVLRSGSLQRLFDQDQGFV